MLRRAYVATMAAACASAMPAAALPPVGSEVANSDRGDRIGPHDPDSSTVRFADAATGIRLTSDAFVAEDGTPHLRRGIVGSIAVARQVEVGLGLLSVSRYSRGEPSLGRLQPMRDVTGRNQRIAAVGISLRF